MNALALSRPAPADLTVPARSRGRGAMIAVAAVAFVAVTAQLAALRAGNGWLWGADAYAFLPRVLLWLGLVAMAALLVVALRHVPRPLPDETHLSVGRRAAWPWLGTGVGLIGAALAFWSFRIRHVLLGDGIPITNLLPGSHEIHPREPLGSWLLQVFHRVLEPVFSRPGVPRSAIVQDCVATGSGLAGILFVVAGGWLAREIVLCFPAREPENRRWLLRVLCLGLLAQGYVQIFFGYVEIYAFPAMVITFYLATSLRFLRGAGPITVPLGLAALGVALHFAVVVLGPSALVLAGAGLLDPRRRRAVGRDLALIAAISVAVVAWLALGPARYPVLSHVTSMLASGKAGAEYLLSVPHVRDFLNEHLLIGPFGLMLLVPLSVMAAMRRPGPRPQLVFLLVAGLSAAWACWITPDLPLGYARDWDLFAPFGLVMAAAAIAVALALVSDAGTRWRMVAVTAIVSLFHTVPWIALNASELQSLERFKTLPLGFGRAETTVAYWHAARHDFPEAKLWLKRSLAIDPLNHRAMDLYGRIAFEERNPRLALQAYLIALTFRPDKAEYRSQLALAVAGVGGPGVGLGMLDTLMTGHEENGVLWLERAMLLRADGRAAEAVDARRRAIRLSPDLATAVDTLPAVASLR